MGIGNKGGIIGFLIGIGIGVIVLQGYVCKFLKIDYCWLIVALFVGILLWKIIPI
jgi:hypothetical protein